MYFVSLFYQGNLEKKLENFFYSLNVRFCFLKQLTTSGQLIIACLNNLDMINIFIESFKLVLNEIKHIENKNSFIIIIIRTDAFIKGGSNEMASQNLQLHPCDTDLENTSLLMLI